MTSTTYTAQIGSRKASRHGVAQEDSYNDGYQGFMHPAQRGTRMLDRPGRPKGMVRVYSEDGWLRTLSKWSSKCEAPPKSETMVSHMEKV